MFIWPQSFASFAQQSISAGVRDWSGVKHAIWGSNPYNRVTAIANARNRHDMPASIHHRVQEITAVHNHLLNESPHIMYMHIHGQGDAVKLATSLKDALAMPKTPATAPVPPGAPPDPGFDTKQLDAILGRAGKNDNGIYQYSNSARPK